MIVVLIHFVGDAMRRGLEARSRKERLADAGRDSYCLDAWDVVKSKDSPERFGKLSLVLL